MTSQINYLGINENFPVAGQDNDTQTFRDNFDTIKTSLRYAKEEITALQSDSAKLTDANDFDENLIGNAVMANNKDKLVQLGNVPLPSAISNIVEIDFENGSFQTLKATQNIVLEFTNFPGDPAVTTATVAGMGKVMIELYGDGTTRTITFNTSAGTVFKKDAGFPALFQVSSTTNPVFIEVWRYRADEIFLRYLGQYS